MNDDERQQVLNHLAQQLNELIVDTQDRSIIRRIREAMAGLRAQRYETTNHHSAYADPTADAAVAHTSTFQRDRATMHLYEIDRAIGRLDRDLRRIRTIIDSYPAPHVAIVITDDEFADKLDAEPHCENCARVKDSQGRPMWSPVHSHLSNPTTVGGRLDLPIWICRWCYQAVQRRGSVPTETEVELHHRGFRVRFETEIGRPA